MPKKENIYFDKQKTGGRPRLVLNENGKELIQKLSSIMCTETEIQNILECDIDTLKTKHNIDEYKKCREIGMSNAKRSLRKWQFQAAEKGNASILIWLGKQYLGQKENPDVEKNIDEIKNNIDLLKDVLSKQVEERNLEN